MTWRELVAPIKRPLRRWLRGDPVVYTEVPGQEPIRLVAWYDEFLGYYPRCEMRSKAWLVAHARRDWTVLDCGANIGYYAILFARLAPDGHVYAFEPSSTYELLCRNLSHHGLTNVTPLRVAVGKEGGIHQAKIARIWGRPLEATRLEFTTIDDFVERRALTRVDLLKIDVDSYDFEALQGAEKTLARFDPWLIVELADIALHLRHTTANAALGWLARRGYERGIVLEDCNYLLRRSFEVQPHREERLPLTLYLP